MENVSSTNKGILVFGIAANLIAILQFFALCFVIWLSINAGLNEITLYIMLYLAWLAIPLLSLAFSIVTIVSFVNSAKDNMAKLGLIFGCVAIPVNIAVFIIDTVMALLS